VQRAVEFPKTHNVGELLDLVARAGIEIPGSVALAKRLTLCAVGARDPRLEDDVTPEEWRVAAASAEAVVRWAERVIAEERSSPSG
jgi:HEPN domain-containing protein